MLKGTIFLGGREQHSCPIQDSCLFSLRFPLIFPCIPIFPTRNESILASIFLVSKGVYPWVAGWRSRRGEHHTTEAQGSGEAPHPLFGRTQEPPTPEEFIFSASLLLPQWRCLPPVACHRLLPDAGTELCLEIVGGWGGSTPEQGREYEPGLGPPETHRLGDFRSSMLLFQHSLIDTGCF